MGQIGGLLRKESRASLSAGFNGEVGISKRFCWQGGSLSQGTKEHRRKLLILPMSLRS